MALKDVFQQFLNDVEWEDDMPTTIATTRIS